MKTADIQCTLERYALDPTDEDYWTLVRHADRTTDHALLESIVALKAIPGSPIPWHPSKEEHDWMPTWDRAAHERMLAKVGAFIDEAFDIGFSGKSSRVKALLELVGKRPRLLRTGVEKWARANLDYGHFGYARLFEHDWERLMKSTKLPRNCKLREIADATKLLERNHRTVRGSKSTQSREVRKLNRWRAREWIMAAIRNERPDLGQFLAMHISVEQLVSIVEREDPADVLNQRLGINPEAALDRIFESYSTQYTKRVRQRL